MKKLYAIRYALYAIVSAFILSGCVVRTYPLTKDRIDQDLTVGNRGYIKGGVPAGIEKERKTTRDTRVVEIELHSPIKFERMSKYKNQETTPILTTADSALEGNRGYITERTSNEIAAPAAVERYTVQKGDTLQKISKKFYGTTKKWMKIYQANQNVLKAPDKVYPGQVISIPLESLQEPKGNLK